MADLIISLTIPGDKIQAANTGFFKIYPNYETVDDPDWVDPGDGTTVPQIPKYTDLQWFKEQLRRLIIRDVRRGLQMIATEAAQVETDDTIVS